MHEPGGQGIYYVSRKLSGLLTAYQARSRLTVDILADDISQPAISQDGKRVMYVRYLELGRTELWVANMDGSERLKLASSSELGTLYWSPDSSLLTFTDGPRCYVVGQDGRGLHEIKGLEGPVTAGAWAGRTKLFITTIGASGYSIWSADASGSSVEKIVDQGFHVTDVSPDGRYLLGGVWSGGETGVYQLAVEDKKRVLLVPNVSTLPIHFSPDSKSFLYAVAGSGDVTFYRQSWHDGCLVGTPQVALKIPFAFPSAYAGVEWRGSAFDFSRDLSKNRLPPPGRPNGSILPELSEIRPIGSTRRTWPRSEPIVPLLPKQAIGELK
jgi:hypothetical protein